MDFFHDLQKEIFEIKDRNPQLKTDHAFVAWFLRVYITEDEKQAIQALTGNAGDKSSDAIYFDHENKLVFIIQGKYHSRSSILESRSHVIALADVGKAILSEGINVFNSVLHKANPIVQQRLKEGRNLIHKKGYTLVARYVTTGRISETNQLEAERRFDEFENGRFEKSDFQDLNKLMQDYLEGAAPPVPTIYLPVNGLEVFTRRDSQTKITSWIFTMLGSDVGRIFNDVGIRLFARNIRGYLGSTGVNKVMKYTLDSEPQNFWYYNNGITIVCDTANQIKSGTTNVIKVTNSQIINGQQTTRTLAQVEKNNAEVLVKVFEITRDNSANDSSPYKHLVSEIVSATNWQNAISQSDLKSNDAEQVRIEKEAKKLNYFYIRKRMSKSEAVKYGANDYSFKITKEELARAVAACNLDPYEVRVGKDRLFEDELYGKIFNGRKVSEYIVINWVSKSVSYWSKQDKKLRYAKWPALSLVWQIVGGELRKSYMRDQFRAMIEREYTYGKELRPYNLLIKQCLLLSKRFYAANKRRSGETQELIDFYKHPGLHKKLYSFYMTNKKSKNRIDKSFASLIKNIQKAKDQ